MGRKRKPDSQKVVAGTFRKDRSNANAPIPDDAPLSPPDWLPDDAVEHFHTLAQRIEKIRVDSATDTEMVAIAALMIAQIKRCAADVREHGETVVDSKGTIKSNPSASHMVACAGRLQQLLAEFGLSPASRTKVSARQSEGPPARFQPKPNVVSS